MIYNNKELKKVKSLVRLVYKLACGIDESLPNDELTIEQSNNLDSFLYAAEQAYVAVKNGSFEDLDIIFYENNITQLILLIKHIDNKLFYLDDIKSMDVIISEAGRLGL